MINILFCAWNRLEFTKASFQSLLQHTDWSKVASLHVHDDGSTDGTGEYLQEQIKQVPVKVVYESRRLGGPVAAMIRHLKLFPPAEEVDRFFKADNDLIVPPGWLPELLRVSNSDPGVDVLGIAARFGPPAPGLCETRRIEEARHIGGIGLIRYRLFEVCQPVPQGLYGWSEFQVRHLENRKGWLTPDIACFNLDLVDIPEFAALSAQYEAKGWQRPWSKYLDGGKSYYDWWAG